LAYSQQYPLNRTNGGIKLQRINLISFAVLLLFGSIVYAQKGGDIKGVIYDKQTNSPLPGASVILGGTQNGSATDNSGNYEIQNISPGKYKIEAHYVGYETQSREVTVSAGQTLKMDFYLITTALKLNEVVVTGAETAVPKEELGNSISTVNARQLQMSGSPSIDEALVGKVPGALVEQNSGNPAGGISIRLRGTSTVLGSGDPLYIIDGVIVDNSSNQLIDLGGYDQNRLVDIDPNDIDHIEVVKGAAAAALYGSRANNGVIQIFTKHGTEGKPRITYSTGFSLSDVRKTLAVNTAPIDASGNPVTRYDLQNDIFRTATGTDQYLSISGGSGNTRYFTSGSYLGNQGIIKATDFQRGNLRARIDQVVNNWMNFSIGATYAYDHSDDLPNGGLASSYGVLTGFIFGPNTYDPNIDPATGEYPHNGILANPVEAINLYKFTQSTSRFLGDAQLNLVPIDGLNINYILGYDTYTQNGTAYIPIGTSAPGYANGLAQDADLRYYQMNNNINISYQKDISPVIKSTSLVGGTMQYENSTSLGTSATNLSPVSQIVPSGATQSISEFRSEEVIYGVFAQEMLGFENKLFLTGAGRFDASSVFSQDNRWQFYPKVSLSYLLSQEDFWKNWSVSKYISKFKLRAAYGESGGLTAIGPYDRFTNFTPLSYSGLSGLIASTQMGSEDIKPEREKEFETGTDISLFSDRLGFEFTYYDKNVSDLLLSRELAPSTGFSTQLANVGTMEDRGIELLVRAIPINTENFSWTSTLTYSANKNVVNGIPGGVLIIPNSFGLVAAVNGQPLGVFYGSSFLRDANGNIVYVNGIPQRDPNSKVIGDPNPKWVASFINEFQIGRHLSFRIQLDGVFGNDVFDFTQRLGDYPAFGTLQGYGDELEGKLPKGYNAAVFNIFENWIQDGSFVKVREVSVSYVFNPEALGIETMRVSLIGRNLFSFDNYPGYDPETNLAAQATAVRGFDFVQVPIPRTFDLNLSFTF
jgi:TonB-dependent starch-binding outer membrane protein SusC